MVLAFRHIPREPLGTIGDALDARGIAWQYIDMWQSPQPERPAVEQAQALVFLGGFMSAYDPLPWLREEESCIRNAVSSGIPVLGVCLGAQLVAKALGARVYAMGRKEIGWYPVRFTDSGMNDPLFQGLGSEEMLFHWHGDTFELPAGAEWLAYSAICRHQAFRCGSNVYGLQFHAEVTPEIIASWCREDAACGDQREAQGPIDEYAHQQRMRELSDHIFGRWCDLVMS